jgi:hypothetical protein
MTHFIIPGFESSLSFRPDTYWEHDNAVSAIVSNIKGTYRRQRITQIVTAEGEERELNETFPGVAGHPDFYDDDAGDDLRPILSGIHPAFMGGEYLAGYLRGEVEIARIELQSVTADVCSIRARRRTRQSRILYRVVDEYPEYGQWELRVRSSTRPLTFRKLVQLIDTAVSPLTVPDCATDDLTDSMRNGYGDDIEGAVRFVTVSSHFYPGIEEYYERKAELWLEERRAEMADDEDEDVDGEVIVSDEDEFGQDL